MDFALIETLRWTPYEGFVRLPLHLARMETSAGTLGFKFDRNAAIAALENAAGGSAALRMRLELARDGGLGVTAAPYVPVGLDTAWRLAIASTRLNSEDSLLRHKTTRRDSYAAARAEFPAEVADEVILLNESGLVCEGTFTNLFVRREPDGPLLTPPLSCGLLPGVLRRALLETGEAREAFLAPGYLADAAEIFCGNSLRGLIPATLR